MSVRKDVISNLASEPFKRPPVARVMRNTLRLVALNALIAWSAVSVDGWLSWLLWIWLALRILPLFFVGVLSAAIDERQRRLSLLPSQWRQFLLTGRGDR